jgi:succinoglycan biosynthesis transport protein ExoP
MLQKKQEVVRPEFLPLSIARMLWKRKIGILLTALAALAVTGVTVYKLPAIYRSEALVLVDSQKIPEKYVTSTVNADVGDRLATISQQIMSTTRLLKIIESFSLYQEDRKSKTQEEVIEQMRKDISLKVEKGWTGGRPGAFRVGYEGRNPTLVAEVANQLANLYVDENLKTREVQAEGTAEFIDSQLAEAKKVLDDLEAKVSVFKSKYNGQLPEQENFLLGTISTLQTQLQGNQDAVNRAQQSKVMLETALAAAHASEQVLSRPAPVQMRRPDGTTVATGAGAVVQKSQSAQLQMQLDQLKMRYNADHPDMKALASEVERLKLIEQEEQRASAATANPAPKTPGTPDAPPAPEPVSKDVLQQRERVASLETQLTLTNREIQNLNAERPKILQQIASYQGRIGNLPMVEQQMAALTRDYEMSKANYKSLLDKKNAAGMATDMERRQKSERFTIIDPARVAEKPLKPNRPLLAGIGAVLSVALGFLLGFGVEIRKNALLGEWEMPADVQILGRIPYIRPVAKATASSGDTKRMAAIVSAVGACVLTVAAGAYWVWGRS